MKLPSSSVVDLLALIASQTTFQLAESHHSCDSARRTIVNASHFKAHFGSVLDEADKKPIRIARRGRPAAILVSEKDYRKLAEKDEGLNPEKKAAVKRLFETIENTMPEFSEEGLRASVKNDPLPQ